MTRIFSIIAAVTVLTFAAAAGESFLGEGGQGTPVPYRALPAGSLGAFVPDWSDASMPHYAIMANFAEWQAKFPPSMNMGGKRPPQPNPSLFEQAALILVARVSESPPQGHPALFVKSFELVDGEAILTYGFFPPEARGGPMVKNVMLLAIPLAYVDSIRILEEIETPASMAAARELEAARAAGRFKPPAIPR